MTHKPRKAVSPKRIKSKAVWRSRRVDMPSRNVEVNLAWLNYHHAPVIWRFI